MRPWTKEPAEGRFTLEQARAVARSFSALHREAATRDVAAHLEERRQDELRAKEALAEVRRAAAEAAQRQEQYTLLALCNWYAKHLAAQGKPSERSVRSQIKCHIEPSDVSKLPANSVSPKQIAAVIRGVVEAGKGRTAGQVRSLLHAAYELACKAELDGSIPSELIKFQVEANPVASTGSMAKYNKTRERALSGAELGAFWRKLNSFVDAVPLAVRALRLDLLLGGQRGQQLLRVRRIEDVDLENDTITIYDPKGRRATPRVHLLPLVDAARTEIDFLISRSESLESPWLFASQKSKLSNSTVSVCVREISAEFVKEGISANPFRFDDLRRTVETMMASMRLSKDTRAQIQSHGLSGVQTRHYDRHDYADEKRNALVAWATKLDALSEARPKSGNVRELRKA